MKKGILSTISFILFLCVFCIGSLIIPDKKYSEMENRSLSEFPKISVSSLLSGETQGELTTYSSDQLILRDFLVSLKVSAQNALGKKDIGEVYLGEDDYYIEKKLEIDESIMNGNIDAISLFSKNHKELNPVFIPILTKGEVLKDKLPNMNEDEMLEILSTNGMLVKRPLIISDDVILTGFKEKEWEDNLL